MNDSIYELACRLVDLASTEGPVDDALLDIGEKFTELAHELHGQESPEQDEQIENAVRKLMEAFQAANVERAGFVAKICGALFEWAIIEPFFEDQLSEIIDSSISGALVYDSRLQQALAEGLEYESAIAAANKSLPKEAIAWAKLEQFYLPILSIYGRFPKSRELAAGRWLSSLSKFETSNAAHWLVRMLKTLHRERVLVIEPSLKRGFEGWISEISCNFELHDLLAMLWWENRIKRTPGINRFVEALKPMPKAGQGTWNLYNWQAATHGKLPNASDQSASAQWIWGEGCPADISVFEDRRVILLGPPSYPRGWNEGAELPLSPKIEVQNWLNAAEVNGWMHRFDDAKHRSGIPSVSA